MKKNPGRKERRRLMKSVRSKPRVTIGCPVLEWRSEGCEGIARAGRPKFKRKEETS